MSRAKNELAMAELNAARAKAKKATDALHDALKRVILPQCRVFVTRGLGGYWAVVEDVSWRRVKVRGNGADHEGASYWVGEHRISHVDYPM